MALFAKTPRCTLPHNGEVKRATFSADSRRILTLSEGTVRIWQLPRDDRPTEDMLLLARIHAGGLINDAGAFVPYDEDSFKKAWQTLQTKYPQEFGDGARLRRNKP